MDSKELHKIAGEYARKIAKDKRLENAGDTLLVGAMLKYYLEQSVASANAKERNMGMVFVSGDASSVDVVSTIETSVGTS